MLKKILSLFCLGFIFSFSTSAKTISKNESNVDPFRISLSYIEGTYASEFEDYQADKLVDDKFGNTYKWFSHDTSNYAIFDANCQVYTTKFIIYNGADTSDFPDRRWLTWSFYGSTTKLGRNDSGWVNLYTSSSAMGTSNCTSRSGATTSNSRECTSSDKTNSYQYFKVECTSTENMQMGEMDLIGIPKCLITYKDKGGSDFSGTHESGYPTSHTYGNGDTTLKSATKLGHTFEGWYSSIDCTGSKITTLGSTSYTQNITLYAKWSVDVSNPPITSIGGYYKNGNNKQAMVSFGVTFSNYDKLSDGDTCGIYVYSDSSGTLKKEFSTTDIASVKSKQGRFYCVYDTDDKAIYYAKGYVIIGGSTVYSDLISATGDLSGTEYII